MDITIKPGKLSGTLSAIPSKSQAHRMLICAAFADKPTKLHCKSVNQDIEATANCLRALGATINRTEYGYHIIPVSNLPDSAVLNCNESGSTLRFMLPIAGALGVDTVFQMSGRLPSRPLSPLWEEMERMGCLLSRPTSDTLRLKGKLKAGIYTIDGGVSSQFITGLLFATALINGRTELNVTGKVESKPYIDMTLKALHTFGVETDGYSVRDNQRFQTPGQCVIEGDWSNAAFFLAANALGSDLEITGLDLDSPQGDRVCRDILQNLSATAEIDAADVPDLVPILAVTAGALNGAKFRNIARLRLKESDRVATVTDMLSKLGCAVFAEENALQVFPGKYQGCVIDASGDHRIAMSAAIAATVAGGPVTILGAECVAKSYPTFWEEYKRLGGNYEQHIW